MYRIKRAALLYPALEDSIFPCNKFQAVAQKLMRRPKLGLDYLRAALLGQEVESQVFDQTLINFDRDQLIGLIKKGNFDLVGIYSSFCTLKQTILFIQEIKKHLSMPIIVGGPGCIHYRELIESGCQIVCHGEADQTIIEIVDYYRDKIKLETIKGISYYDHQTKQILSTCARELIDNLDRLAFPLRDPHLVKQYYDYFAYPLQKPYVTVLASRGCPYHCAYCTSYSFWGNQYRQRSVENVLEEIQQLITQLGVKYIYFIDDVFALNFNWLEKFCSAIKKKRYNLKWMCTLHPLSFQGDKEKAFQMMAASGCTMISFGAQSANAGVLKNINRDPVEPAELSKSIYLAKKAGITVVVSYIFGLPQDTPASIRESFEFCLKTKPHLVDFHTLGIIPGSRIASLYPKGLFTESQKLELIRICTKYSREYYTRPAIVFQLLKDILIKNPAWFFKFIRFVPDLLKLVIN